MSAKQVPTESSSQEELVTDESDNDVPALVSNKKINDEPKKPVTKPVETPKQKPSKNALDAINNAINGTKTEGDGDDDAAGNKGKNNGAFNTKNYEGDGSEGDGKGDGKGDGEGPGKGNGKGGGWTLKGRKLMSSGKVEQKCNEYGVVVVEVTVNRQGDVVGCKAIQGTDNRAKCLLDAAYATARKYKWYPRADARDLQIGTITVNFKQS